MNDSYTPSRFMLPTSYYDKQAADHAVMFIEMLSHTKGEWYKKPFKLLPWQKTVVRDLFGTIKEDGTRQFRTAYVEIAKKQGKSELAAAIALYLLAADGEQRAEVYSAAADRQQASIIFNVAADMVRLCPALDKRCKILTAQRRIIFQPTNSIYQVLSADAGTKAGFNISGLLFDELFNQKDRRLVDILTKGTSDARRQGLHFFITTAGDNINSVCYEYHQKAVDILKGRKTDPTFYPVVYSVPMEADWTDPENWKLANPSLGITVGLDKLHDACESAKQNPAEENSFRQFRLCQWVKQTTRWMPIEKWDVCSSVINEEQLRGRICYAGLDLSSTTDLTALVLVFPPCDADEKYQILPYIFIPEETIDLRSRRDHVNYDLWKKQGHIIATEGNVVDYDYILKLLCELNRKFVIKEVAYDRWNASMLVTHLVDEGFTMVPFGQGFASMSEPCKQLMRLTLDKQLAHGGHPVLRWCMDNVVVKQDPAGNIKFNKEKATEKIDAAVALVMALDRALRGDSYMEASVYENRGLLFI